MSGNIMNAAVMGMNAQTSWLATISQNIANSSTTGYKDAETEFSSLVDQSSPGNYSAGGVATTAISMNGLQGSIIGTSTVTDLAIQGNGFFVVTDAAGDTFLTRNGSFVPDASGNLVNSAGYYLMGTDIQNGNSTPGREFARRPAEGQCQPDRRAGERRPRRASSPPTCPRPRRSFRRRTPAPAPRRRATTYTEKTSLVTYDNLGTPVTLDVYMTNVSTPPCRRRPLPSRRPQVGSRCL